MVSVLLTGGLGNQMFQYAAARALALRLETQLCIDLYSYNKKTEATPRNYELDIFSIQPEIVDKLYNRLIYKSLTNLHKNTLGQKVLNTLNIFHDRSCAAISYLPRFTEQSGNVVMLGYFQNEKYFANISDLLIKDFTFRVPFDEKNKKIADQIKNTNSVSFHIRRGDYTYQPSNLNLLEKDYYMKAYHQMLESVDNPTFFIFSDDHNWTKSNLNLDISKCIFIDWNTGRDSYRDMQLMSLCCHNIIANSSFSWWGAWLNNNPNKTVLAPRNWYKRDDYNQLLDGFIPKSWTII